MRGRKEHISITQNICEAFLSSFSLPKNGEFHVFIQCSHLIANFWQFVILGLKLIEQLLKGVCNSCCGN